MIKYLFEPLSLAATFTIGASYVLALTVVPAFCASFVRERASEANLDNQHNEHAGLYGSMLGSMLKAPVLSAMAVIFVGGRRVFPVAPNGHRTLS